MPVFIIEHLEPEIYDWCIIEYGFISKIVGKNNLVITNIKEGKASKLKGFGKITEKSAAELKLESLCLLDSNAKQSLSSSDAKKFRYFLFGGILGDNPPKGRTKEMVKKLRKHKIEFQTRNLGTEQMPTDTAVYAAKQILEGKKLKEFKFSDSIEIEINDAESIVLPYRYILEKGKPVISGRLIEYLKKKDSF